MLVHCPESDPDLDLVLNLQGLLLILGPNLDLFKGQDSDPDLNDVLLPAHGLESAGLLLNGAVGHGSLNHVNAKQDFGII